MGDNIHLGDRNGVRTPMQWNCDRNAGFSRADPSRLYSPVISDAMNGYQSINVESQTNAPSSMLNAVKRLIRIRRRYRVFGVGEFTIINADNPSVFSFVRHSSERAILVVTNLSRFVRPVHLDLSAYAGQQLVEILGGAEFPRVESAPYFLSMGPHAYYWFEINPC